jgi:steroid delta-isomerase-like uncharacterized protein
MEKSYFQIIQEANTKLIIDRDLDAVGNFFTLDYTVHLTGRDFKGGHKIVRDTLSELQKSFPDIQVDVDILIEGKERVAWQRTLRGMHEGAFKGFPASGLQIVWRDMVTSRFRDGLIAEEWVITDLAEQLLLSRKRKK